jgi:23S rRNA pseudouridine2605 synthase
VGETGTERLNRFLARRGVASRRGADVLIGAGRISVNGAPAQLGATVSLGADQVAVDGVPLASAHALRTILLNKPVGVVSTRHDPQRRRTVMDLVEAAPGLVPVGRLDADSRGLLLLTTDGELAHRVTHPRFGITKRYLATVSSPITPAHLLHLRRGMKLIDGVARALGARRASGRIVEIVMGEGRRREVRRLCLAVGLDVVDLQRVGVGPLTLTDVDEGRSRPLTPDETDAIYTAVGLAPPAPS